MNWIPRHPWSRRTAALWLAASVVMLAATLARPDIGGGERAALVYLTPLYWMSFPFGHAGVMASIQLRVELHGSGIPPSILAEGLFLWTSLTLLGYAQWFVLLPWISRACWHLSNRLFVRRSQPAGDRARSAVRERD